MKAASRKRAAPRSGQFCLPIAKKGRWERRRRRKGEAIVGQVSINFLQKGARLNVSGLLKCSFHRGEAEKRDERGGDPGAGGEKRRRRRRRRSGDRARFFRSHCTPNSAAGKECARLRICVRIVRGQRRELRLLWPNKACQSHKGRGKRRKAELKVSAQRETSKSIF